MPTDKPTNPPRPPTGRPMLRLHRDEPEPGIAPAETYKFPGTPLRADALSVGGRWASRRRLVAAQVREAPVERTFEGNACGMLNGSDDPDCIGRIVTSNQLVREIEETLDRMQNRLTDFRDEMDRAFKFPRRNDDDDLPPAA